MLHGLLHLAGYDHETDKGEMARREQKLRASLRLPHGLIERTTSLDENSGAQSIPQPHLGAADKAMKLAPARTRRRKGARP
jgi:probable rRNA maturation factor